MTSLQDQDYEGPIEIVFADGGSTDGTRQSLETRAARGEVVLVDNPQRRQWAGLNRAAAIATGEILVRVDGHSVYAADYVRRSVTALQSSGATAAGGRMIPVSDHPLGRAIAAAMASRWAVGPARYRHQEHPSLVDTVYLGAFRKDDFERLGGYRDLPGVAEDADLYFRWRRQGATVLLDPSIKSDYRPRTSWRALTRQYFRYGWGKADMLYANRVLPSLRPLAPLGLIVGLIGGAGLGILTSVWWPLGGLVGAWFLVLLAVGLSTGGTLRHRLRTSGVTATMQTAFGVGLVSGLGRGPRSRRHLRPQ